jgi:hypothetical protein
MLPPRASKGRGLTFLARNGHAALVHWVSSIRPLPFDAAQLNSMLAAAARGGRLELLGTIKGWGATELSRALASALAESHFAVVEILIAWGAQRGPS